MRQWDDAMEQMRRNDDAIQAATQLFADSKGKLREKQVQLDGCAKLLDDELVNNKEYDAQIGFLSREMERVRGVYASEQVALLLLLLTEWWLAVQGLALAQSVCPARVLLFRCSTAP
jgi:hypothetical protein